MRLPFDLWGESGGNKHGEKEWSLEAKRRITTRWKSHSAHARTNLQFLKVLHALIPTSHFWKFKFENLN